MPDVLPDSRLASDVGAVMYDWPMGNGRTLRTECIPIFCANCGVPHGYVPKDNTTFAFWLCQKCFDAYGTIAGTMVEPDAEYWAKVEAQMIESYGHALNPLELLIAAEQGWGPLAKLVKESPIKLFNHQD